CKPVGLVTQGRPIVGRLSKYLRHEPVGLVIQGKLTAGQLLTYLRCEPMGLVTQGRPTTGRLLTYLGSKLVGLRSRIEVGTKCTTFAPRGKKLDPERKGPKGSGLLLELPDELSKDCFP
ncbi:hypothetical protein AMTR_s00015p00195310, partial [Amborella trichopoda]